MSLWGGQRVPSDPRGHPKVPIPNFSGFEEVEKWGGPPPLVIIRTHKLVMS